MKKDRKISSTIIFYLISIVTVQILDLLIKNQRINDFLYGSLITLLVICFFKFLQSYFEV
jgi:hypothetical protein